MSPLAAPERIPPVTAPVPPVVLLATGQEWFSRSIESILTANGYAVLLTHTASTLLERARRGAPDAVVIDLDLPDLDGLTVTRTLRSDHRLTSSTPLILVTGHVVTRTQRIAALRAGAAELLGSPLDADEFLLRLSVHLRAKSDADRARAEGLVDATSGLYNLRGLARRGRELAAHASRALAPLACIVFAPEAEGVSPDLADGEALYALGDRLAAAFRRRGRDSDIIARVGAAQFAVLSALPAADAVRVAERLGRAVSEEATGSALRLRVGHYAIPAPPPSTLDPLDLLTRASAALAPARSTGSPDAMGPLR